MVVPNDFIDFKIPTFYHLSPMSCLALKSRRRTLSSAQEKRYGCRSETPNPRMVEMWPVNDSFNSPDARSQI